MLDSLSLRNFRNYSQYRLQDIGPLTILVGRNAIGKTSIIEAIQMVTALSSFRTSSSTQMIAYQAAQAEICARFLGNQRDLKVDLLIEPGKKLYKLNGKSKLMSSLKGLFPAVSFCPDDLHMVKGSNAVRRAALDSIGTQLSKNFYAVKADYEKLIKQKNKALKDEASDLYIDSIDEILVRVGVQLLAHRMIIISQVQPLLQQFYRDITNGAEEVSLAYVPCWDKERTSQDMAIKSSIASNQEPFDKHDALQKYQSALKEARPKERAWGRAMIGPHADEVEFILQGRNALHFASQGQQRTVVLAFKLAESALIQNTLGQKPILLLDDVMSELDEERRSYFMDFISDDIQTFITTTNIDYFSNAMKQKARIVMLEREE